MKAMSEHDIFMLHDPRTWPPGSMIKFSPSHHSVSVGLIVANDGRTISIIWDTRRFSYIDVYYMNEITCSRYIVI